MVEYGRVCKIDVNIPLFFIVLFSVFL